MEPVVENNKDLKVAKIINFGMSLDERVADGFYMGKCLKLFRDLLMNPDSLLEEMPEDATMPKILRKKKSKVKKVSKTKKEAKEKKEKKPKKIKPLKNKEKHDKKMKKAKNKIEQ